MPDMEKLKADPVEMKNGTKKNLEKLGISTWIIAKEGAGNMLRTTFAHITR